MAECCGTVPACLQVPPIITYLKPVNTPPGIQTSSLQNAKTRYHMYWKLLYPNCSKAVLLHNTPPSP